MGWVSYSDDVSDRHDSDAHAGHGHPLGPEPPFRTPRPTYAPAAEPTRVRGFDRFRLRLGRQPKIDLAPKVEELRRRLAERDQKIALLEGDAAELRRAVGRLESEKRALTAELARLREARTRAPRTEQPAGDQRSQKSSRGRGAGARRQKPPPR
ncbi:hypothetical protein [Pseudonocardia lacus]|uniref:hypothetical protein n=1 Tax=Pseudonocardia lacus TaxID=2835865 RepID=UPI001BDC31DD|nr:hypothetical protein [Pseudonocardia lacus]